MGWRAVKFEVQEFLVKRNAWYWCDGVVSEIAQGNNIELDMAETKSIDYDGFRALIHCARAAERNQVDLVVVNPSREARALLELTRLDHMLPISGTDPPKLPEVKSHRVSWVVAAASSLWAATFGYLLAKGID
jgi:anti-anti-sigma factor